MRIATWLRISAAATVAAVIILVPVLYWAYSAYREAQSGHELAEAIQRNFTERASFRDQYFLYREDRVRILWDESKAQSDQLLNSARSRFQGEANAQAVERIRRAVEQTRLVFYRVVGNTPSLKSAAGNREVFEELDKRLYSQLLLKAADVRDAITSIHSLSVAQEQQAYRRLTMIFGMLALVLASSIVFNAVQIGGLIRRRLLMLHDSASRVAAGDLTHRIDSGGGDEFSEVARAINGITEKLQLLTQDLEAKVRSRTAELQQSESRLRSVFNAMSEGFSIQELVCDKAGKPIDLRFVTANPAFERQIGLKNADTLGHTLRELFPQAESSWIERCGGVALTGEAADFDAVLGPFNKHYQVSAFQTEPGHVGTTLMDISERKQHEARQALVAQRMEALLRLPAAAEGCSETEFLQYGLDQVEALTGSPIAFVHFVNDDQETIELVTWSQATLKDYCHAAFDRHYPISQAGIWADALRQRKPVIVNDYATASGKHGLPEGHAHLERLISVPVIDTGLVRMMLGVGNKPQPYSELDMETTRLLAESLWHIVSQRRAEDMLHAAHDQLRQLAIRLNRKYEMESSLLSRELHDEFGQMLTRLKMDLALIASRLDQGSPELTQRVASSLALVDESMRSVQSIAARLRPRILDELGLLSALDWLVQDFRERSGIDTDFVANAQVDALLPEEATAVFRIVQESLSNIARHAEAKRIDVSLERQDDWLAVEIRDDGKGLHGDEVTSYESIGLLGMRERALAVGGSLSLTSVLGKGTLVSLRVPLTKEQT
jgi:signal transduction histidine kinase/PAS domain-containing protein